MTTALDNHVSVSEAARQEWAAFSGPTQAERHGLTSEKLRDLMRYEPETGQFVCLKNSRARKVGDVLGGLDLSGYQVIPIHRQMFKAHRLAVLYMTGAMPPSHLHVDHLNRNRSDNRWLNLRVVTVQENNANMARPPMSPALRGRRQCSETDAGLALMEQGFSIRDAAARVGVAPSTLTRAKSRRASMLPA